MVSDRGNVRSITLPWYSLGCDGKDHSVTNRRAHTIDGGVFAAYRLGFEMRFWYLFDFISRQHDYFS